MCTVCLLNSVVSGASRKTRVSASARTATSNRNKRGPVDGAPFRKSARFDARTLRSTESVEEWARIVWESVPGALRWWVVSVEVLAPGPHTTRCLHTLQQLIVEQFV